MNNLSPAIQDFGATDNDQIVVESQNNRLPVNPLMKRQSSLEDLPFGYATSQNQQQNQQQMSIDEDDTNFDVAMLSQDSLLINSSSPVKQGAKKTNTTCSVPQPLLTNEKNESSSQMINFQFRMEDDSSDFDDSDEQIDQIDQSDLKLNMDLKQQSSSIGTNQHSPALSGASYDNFRQLDYLWLFDPWVNFKERPEFDVSKSNLEETGLTLSDYNEMRQLNRMLLTQLCIDLDQADFQVSDACNGFRDLVDQAIEEIELDSELRDNIWCDEMLDEKIKTLLDKSDHGRHIPVDLVTHLEYFYNTQSCDAISSIENPFKSVKNYPALCYQVTNPANTNYPEGPKISLFEQHRNLIFPFTLKKNSRSSWLKAQRSQSTNPNTINHSSKLGSGTGDSQNLSNDMKAKSTISNLKQGANSDMESPLPIVTDMDNTSKFSKVDSQAYDESMKSSSGNDPSFLLPQSIAKTKTSTIEVMDLPKGLPAKYKWYPNRKLDMPNGFLRKGQSSQTPGPKTISSFHRHASMQVRNDPNTPSSCMAAYQQLQQASLLQKTGKNAYLRAEANHLGFGGLTANGQDQASQQDMTFGGVSSAVKNNFATMKNKTTSQMPRSYQNNSAYRSSQFGGAPTPKLLANQRGSLLDVDSTFDAKSFV